MHAYSIDTNERRRVQFWLAVGSLPIAWSISVFLNWLGDLTGLPLWLLDAPAIYGCYEFLFNWCHRQC